MNSSAVLPMFTGEGLTPKEKLHRMFSVINKCVLCDSRDVSFTAVFIPRDPDAWGRALGYTRPIRQAAYGLCEPCYGIADRNDRVERRIEKLSLSGKN